MHKTPVQMDQRPQHKTNHTNLIEEKVGRSLEHIGTGDHFRNTTPVAQTLRRTINKWDLLKLKSFCKEGHGQQEMDSLQNGKRSYHPHIRQRSDLQNIQRTQEMGHHKNK